MALSKYEKTLYFLKRSRLLAQGMRQIRHKGPTYIGVQGLGV